MGSEESALLANALTQSLKLRPDMLAPKFPLETGNRVERRIDA
jgi:hypothetical protein